MIEHGSVARSQSEGLEAIVAFFENSPRRDWREAFICVFSVSVTG